MMSRKFCSIRNAGPRAPAGNSRKAFSDGRGNGLSPARSCTPSAFPLARRSFVCERSARRIVEIRRQDDFVAPPFAATPSVRFQIVRRRGDHVGDGVDDVAAAVTVEVDRITLNVVGMNCVGPKAPAQEPISRSGLRSPRAGFRAPRKILRESNRGGGRHRRASPSSGSRNGRRPWCCSSIRRPDGRDDMAVDAVGPLDRRKGRRICANSSRPRAMRSSLTSTSR